jgi:hypothetical protein
MSFREFLLQNELQIKALRGYMPNSVPAPITSTGKRGGAHLIKAYAVQNPSRPVNRIFSANQTQKKTGIANKKH